MTIPKSLPPLPNGRSWSKYFPRGELKNHQHGDRPYRGRSFLTNRKLTDEFVRGLGIRKGEVILDGFGGIGNVTRSLLNGGRAKYGLNLDSNVTEESKWPEWSKEDINEIESENTNDKSENEENLNEPALVITSDPCFEILQRSLDMEEAQRPPWSTDTDYTKVDIYPSKHHPTLLLSNSSPYRWPTVPGILSHPLVQERIKVSEEKFDTDEIPNLTVVCQVPNSELGEQMVSQWVGSVPGGDNTKYWLWKYGRVRLGLLVDQGMYDVSILHYLTYLYLTKIQK